MTNDEFTAWQAKPNTLPEMRMVGQGNGQRSSMTVNHGSYYIDTTVNAGNQKLNNQPVPDKNVFLANTPYYVFLVYATPQTKQTYSMYIGEVPANRRYGKRCPWHDQCEYCELHVR